MSWTEVETMRLCGSRAYLTSSHFYLHPYFPNEFFHFSFQCVRQQRSGSHKILRHGRFWKLCIGKMCSIYWWIQSGCIYLQSALILTHSAFWSTITLSIQVRYTPDSIAYTTPHIHDILTSIGGVHKYLVIDNSAKTFRCSIDHAEGAMNYFDLFPNAEGIDVHNRMFNFV